VRWGMLRSIRRGGLIPALYLHEACGTGGTRHYQSELSAVNHKLATRYAAADSVRKSGQAACGS